MSENTTLFTIGFTKKTAEEFFTKLQAANVKLLVDVRLNNVSQLAAFTKRDDLKYFLQTIAGIGYQHLPELSPTKDILDAYKKKEIEWSEYELEFQRLLQSRHIESIVRQEQMDHACLLCSEPQPDHCHRRLVAEYLQACWEGVRIHHIT